MVIADGDADPGPLALDLLAQAEHGAGSLVVAISDSAELLDALAAQVADEPDTEAVVRFVSVGELEQALAIAEAFAPEHLQLMGAGAEALAPRVRHAGCVFVGADSGTAFGDYIAGSNHVLPTNGAARFASALSPLHFRRRFTEVRIGSDAAALAARRRSDRPRRGLRAARPVDGGSHSRQWHVMTRAADDRPPHR